MLVVNDATPGESHTVTFAAEGIKHGAWQNCAEMDTDLLDATSIACFEGWINQ